MNQKRSFFYIFFELIGWVGIAISPLIIGCFIGLIIYTLKTDKTGLVIAILVALLGFIAGIIWATRVWKKGGTIQFLSRLISSEQMQQKEENDQS